MWGWPEGKGRLNTPRWAQLKSSHLDWIPGLPLDFSHDKAGQTLLHGLSELNTGFYSGL